MDNSDKNQTLDSLERKNEHLSWRIDVIDERSRDSKTQLEDVKPEIITLKAIQQDLKADMYELKQTLNKLVWAIVAMAFTIAAAAIALALQIALSGAPTP